MSDALPFLAVHELADLFRAGKSNPEELLQANLQQIRDYDPVLHAFVSVDEARARAQARERALELQRGEIRSALHGITLAVKDVLDVAGSITSDGVSLDRPAATRSCAAVACLEQAGAVVIGKTNTPAYAAYSDTTSAVGGTTCNAWNPRWSSGGSSGGSAVAVASGMSALSLGTDLGGSVRGPAAWSGIFGMRPSSGCVPRHPHGWVDDRVEVIGALSRDIRDLSIWFDLTCFGPSGPPRALDWTPRPLKIAHSVDLDGRMAVSDEIRAVFDQCVQGLAGQGHQLQARAPQVDAAVAAIRPMRALRALATYTDSDLPIIEKSNAPLAEFVRWARTLSGEALGAGARQRTQAWLENHAFFDDCDLFILPTAQIPGLGAGELQPEQIAGRRIAEPLEVWFSTYIISLLGWPSISVPCGWTPDRHPVGLQLASPVGSDRRLLAIAQQLCAQMGWHAARPDLSRVA